MVKDFKRCLYKAVEKYVQRVIAADENFMMINLGIYHYKRLQKTISIIEYNHHYIKQCKLFAITVCSILKSWKTLNLDWKINYRNEGIRRTPTHYNPT